MTMEKENQNNCDELAEMKAQYASLKQKSETQKIVNDRQALEYVKGNVAKMKKHARRGITTCIVTTVFLVLATLIIDVSIPLRIYSICFWLIIMFSSYKSYWKVLRKKTDSVDDMLSVVECYKELYVPQKNNKTRLRALFLIPFGIIYLVWLELDTTGTSLRDLRWLQNVWENRWAILFWIVFMTIFFFFLKKSNKRKIAQCDEIIDQLKEDEEKE